MSQTHPHFEETQALSLKLEKYTDIFSSFDIRPYSRRALSVDFLDEIKRSIADKKEEEGVEIILNMPGQERNESNEKLIQERLAAHFKRHYQLVLKEKLRILKLGIGMVVLGVISMIAATFIVFEDPAQNILRSFLVVFLEPAAWFLLWEGMDLIIFNSKKLNPDLYFYKKMSHSRTHVHFQSY
jgi:hypothetical protein